MTTINNPDESNNLPALFDISSFPKGAFLSLKVNFLTEYKAWPPTTLSLVFEGAMQLGMMFENGDIVAHNEETDDQIEELYTFAVDYVQEEVITEAEKLSADSNPFFLSTKEDIILNYRLYSPMDVITDLENPLLNLMLLLGVFTFMGVVNIESPEQDEYASSLESNYFTITEEEDRLWTEVFRSICVELEPFLNRFWLERFEQMAEDDDIANEA